MNSKRFRMRIPFQWVAGPGWIFFLLVMVAGCLGPSPDFAKEVRESQQFYVVYYGGRISTRINNQVQSTEKTPDDFRAVTASVARGLAARFEGRKILEKKPGDRITGSGLEVVVLVNGGYFCDGAGEAFSCTLTMQTHLVFRSLKSGRIIGKRHNLVGEVLYGLHLLHLEAGGALRKEDGNGPVADLIRKDLPAVKVINQLLSSTEAGLADFFYELESSDESS